MNKADIIHIARIETVILDGIAHDVLTSNSTTVAKGDKIALPGGGILTVEILNRRAGFGIVVSGFATDRRFAAVRFPKAW